MEKKELTSVSMPIGEVFVICFVTGMCFARGFSTGGAIFLMLSWMRLIWVLWDCEKKFHDKWLEVMTNEAMHPTDKIFVGGFNKRMEQTITCIRWVLFGLYVVLFGLFTLSI